MPHYNGSRPKVGAYWDEPYNPKKEYFFVDYLDTLNSCWIRKGYQTWEQVAELVDELCWWMGYDDVDKTHVRFPQDLRITPERQLAELHQVFNPETNKYEDDLINMRTYLFDGRYDVDERWTGVKSLNKQKDETLEEWKDRVALSRAAQEEKEKEEISKHSDRVHRIRLKEESNEEN